MPNYEEYFDDVFISRIFFDKNGNMARIEATEFDMDAKALALKKIAEHLQSRPDESISIVGHTDADPIVRTKYMWNTNHHLAAGRALSVFEYLTTQGGVDQSRVFIVSYGPNRPVADNATDDGKRKNRRVEFMLTTSDGK